MASYDQYQTTRQPSNDNKDLLVAALIAGAGALAFFFLERKPTSPYQGGLTGVPNTNVTPPAPPTSGAATGSVPICPAGQIFDGITGTCTPVFPSTPCPANYQLSAGGNCIPVAQIAILTPAQLCAQIGYQYDSGSQRCVIGAPFAGELLSQTSPLQPSAQPNCPGGYSPISVASTWTGACCPQGTTLNFATNVCSDGSQPWTGGGPAETLPASVPVPLQCATGFYWNQQNFFSSGQGCVNNPSYPPGLPFATCPTGLSYSPADNACH